MVLINRMLAIFILWRLQRYDERKSDVTFRRK
jgi:hypothetical protein